MHEIDFLPAEYRQRHAQRHAQPWRLLVVGLLGVLTAAAGFGQHRRLGQLNRQLTEIAPQYAAVVANEANLKQLQARIESAGADAELYTYLRHRWPNSRILDAVLAPLPESIAFEQLEIRQESPKGRILKRGGDTAAKSSDSLRPAARDLNTLRDQFDSEQTVVTISGVTTQTAVLHRYLEALAQSKFFAKVNLDAITSNDVPSDAANVGQLRFNVSLIVRPGYGQGSGQSGGHDAQASNATHANRAS